MTDIRIAQTLLDQQGQINDLTAALARVCDLRDEWAATPRWVDHVPRRAAALLTAAIEGSPEPTMDELKAAEYAEPVPAPSGPAAAETPDTAHRYCILCGTRFHPAHTCDPAGLRTMYRGLADRADHLETNNAALVRCAERAGVRRDQLAATLREVLAAYDATGCLSPAQHARWHAALEPAKEQH